MPRIFSATLVLLGFLSPPVSQATPASGARLVSFRLESVVLAPTKADGAPWDGMGSKQKEVLDQALGIMRTLDPRAALVDFLAGPACNHLERPDPYGYVEIAAGSARQAALQLPQKKEEFNPIWSAGWDQLPLDSDTAIRVVLRDRDAISDDDIGVFILNSKDLKSALVEKHVVFVDVHEQGRGILLAGISVLPAD